MTAEIALLNRRAIAFAADSAVTISGAGPDKIYNSAEKVFEFSRRIPIGLMLYNALEFVGIPLDVLIRKFRRERDSMFISCKQACDEFLSFLISQKRLPEDEDAHLISVLQSEFIEICKEFNRRNRDEFLKAFVAADVERINFNDFSKKFIIEIITEHKCAHEDSPLEGFLDDISLDEFEKRFGDVVNYVARRVGGVISEDELLEKLIELSYFVMKSNIFSDSLSGIVVGGFGSDELFPSLHAVEIDGVYFGKLKTKLVRAVDIDRRGERAAIVPFAQSEMVERFLYGIDEDLEGKLLKFIERSGDKAVSRVKLKTGVDVSEHGLSAKSYTADVEKLLKKMKKKSSNETLDMVDFMPKQELAYTAEAFITLTSIKRRVSAQQETVGGPIDVAVITKNEGFVWIKRKHYFDKELNSGYVVRTFRGDVAGMVKTGARNDDTSAQD